MSMNTFFTPVKALKRSFFSAFNSVEHTENFPVASLLLPKRCVPAVHALYRFARMADDIADEGLDLKLNALKSKLSPHLIQDHVYLTHINERLGALKTLKYWSNCLNDFDTHQTDNHLTMNNHLGNSKPPAIPSEITDLIPFIQAGHIDIQPLQNLLLAFCQDIQQDIDYLNNVKTIRHSTLNSVLDYCTRSANPVGRLMLQIIMSYETPSFKLDDLTPILKYSDSICTALQLINFWQDVDKDANHPVLSRRYIPDSYTQRYGDTQQAAMMNELCQDARQRLLNGVPLLYHLSGRFKLEIALTIAGGLRILDRLHQCDYDVKHQRPSLGFKDAPAMFKTVFQLYFNPKYYQDKLSKKPDYLNQFLMTV